MRQPFIGFFLLIAGLVFSLCGNLRAQTTLDAIENALKGSKNLHDETGKSRISQFNADLGRAVGSAQAAVEFFEANGGKVPDPPAQLFQHLRPGKDKSERAEITELYRSEASLDCLAYCELIRFAFRSVTGPEPAEKSPAWFGWLEKQTQGFAQIHGSFLADFKVGDGPPVRQYGLGSVFRNKKEGDWSLNGVPDLYREYILNRLAAEKSPKTSTAWDTYISAMQVRSNSPGRWENVEEPRLRFQKYTALFEMSPNDMDLTRMVDILQNFNQHPDFVSMHKKAEECLARLKSLNKNG